MDNLLSRFYELNQIEKERLAQGEALEEPWLNPVDSLSGGLATLPKGAIAALSDFLIDIPMSLVLEGVANENPEVLKAMYVGKRGMKNLGIDAGKDLAGQFSGLWDQMPRLEIDDSAARYAKPGNWHSARMAQKRDPLLELNAGGFIRDSNLPDELLSIPINLEDMSGGSYHRVTSIDPENIRLGRDSNEDLLHELQHAVQEREGFARGGSPESVLDLSSYDKAIRKLEQIDYELEQLQRGGGIPLTKYDEFSKLSNQRTPLVKVIEQFDRLMNDGVERVKAYKHLAGEIEARDTAHRMNLTPEERMRTQPLSGYAVQNGTFGPTYDPNPISLEDFIVRME